MKPLPAGKALDDYFLEARCKILDLAAILDRLGRGPGAEDLANDPRLQRIRQALGVLGATDPAAPAQETGCAERVQQIFSLEYDPEWERPRPRSA